MNPALILFFLPRGVKRLILLLIVATGAIVLAPVIYLFSYGTGTSSYLLTTGSSATTVAVSTDVQGFYQGAQIQGDTYDWGNCTYWAYALRLKDGHPIPKTWGDANTWDDRARADGYLVDHIPEVGAVYENDKESAWGHVAYVSAVESDGSFSISEMNYKGFNIVDARTFTALSAKAFNFIHDKATL